MLVVEHEDRNVKGKKKNSVITCVAISIFVILLLVMSLNFIIDFLTPQRSGTNLTHCKSNMKNIAIALDMYSIDNQDEYPVNLKKLVPIYLKTMPTCGAAKTDTYSTTYDVSKKHDAYTFYCRGTNHRKAGINVPNYPRCDSFNGLKERP